MMVTFLVFWALRGSERRDVLSSFRRLDRTCTAQALAHSSSKESLSEELAVGFWIPASARRLALVNGALRQTRLEAAGIWFRPYAQFCWNCCKQV